MKCDHRDAKVYAETRHDIGGNSYFVAHLQCERCGFHFGRYVL